MDIVISFSLSSSIRVTFMSVLLFICAIEASISYLATAFEYEYLWYLLFNMFLFGLHS